MQITGKHETDGSTTYVNRVSGDVACIMPTRFNHWLIMSYGSKVTEEPLPCRRDAVALIEARWS